MPIAESVLRRLLVSKTFLASSSGQLSPSADGAAVARTVLSAHDAAELAAAAIAEHVHAAGLTDRLTLMDYPTKIEAQRPDIGPFPGVSFLKQLNDARRVFKHGGVLPDPRQWFRVVETTWTWVDAWCEAYLEIGLDEIDLEQLLEDGHVRGLYSQAKEERLAGRYKRALELIGEALFHVLDKFPGIVYPVVGSDNTHPALLLAAFGVRPGEFLNLQSFVPKIVRDLNTGNPSIEWEARRTGHRANWTERSVDLCLECVLDTALKIQLAPSPPRAMEYV